MTEVLVPPVVQPGRVLDRLARPLGSLRLSVTDRCNLRCRYCMPEEEYIWLPKAALLTFEELSRLARLFSELGAGKVRITGGEPLLRHGLPDLVRQLHALPLVTDLAMTTNGVLLLEQVDLLRAAGLERVTVSLDTLQPARAREFAKTTRHADILAGIRAARDAGFPSVKINAVVIRGFNDDEVVPLLEFARAEGVELRFIEYMDVGGATKWSMDDVVSQAEILARLGAEFGRIEPVGERGSAPASQFRLADGTTFGVIASTTAPFCRDCDRSRLTADGMWYLCLYGEPGIDLREPLRMGATDAELRYLIVETWIRRRDRGAEARLETPDRTILHQIGALRADPRREMHTRGG
jgi:cyclic pyranopterin phosphate synthase